MATRGLSGVVPQDETEPSSADSQAKRAPNDEYIDNESFFNWRRAIEWALLPIAFIVMRFVPDDPLRLPGWLLLLLAGVLFASPAVLASHREHEKMKAVRTAEDLATQYQLRLGLTLGEAVIPIGDLLGRIALSDTDERTQLEGQLRQQVVDAAAGLVGADQARATFFALEGRTLRASAWAGRPDPPSATLSRAESDCDRAYALMEERDRALVSRVREESCDPGFGGAYETYVGVAVYADAKNLGILCVDAPHPGDLVESDVDIVAALAHMLGPGLATA